MSNEVQSSQSPESSFAVKHSELRPYAVGLVLLGGLLRLTPHPWNFTPVGGMSLFAGARMRGWMAYLLPLLVMLITDPLVGGYTLGSPIIVGLSGFNTAYVLQGAVLVALLAVVVDLAFDAVTERLTWQR